MTKDEELEAFLGFNELMHEEDKKFVAPMCHFTPMQMQDSDYQTWWECPHCGHTKKIEMLDRPCPGY
ncbi:MAG: hypothetical protein OES84_00215 [Kiritimatiellaceae bacterium]|nr:hypothetical protein [Kiritimatiellaceae bacterium]